MSTLINIFIILEKMQQLEKSAAKIIAEYGKKMNTAKQGKCQWLFNTFL